MSCEAAFFKELREHGFRLTPQREMVLSVLHQIEGLATVDEIYGRVRDMSSSVDISTVYRTLELLHEFDMVGSVDPGDGQRRYELIGVHGAHAHLVCQVCGQVQSAKLELLQPLMATMEESYGFAVDGTQITLTGLCQQCRAGTDSAD